MGFGHRQARVRVLEALERRARQFRAREEIWPFRVPHEPLDLRDIIERELADEAGALEPESLRARSILRLEWRDPPHAWDLWTIALPSGVLLYCDSDEHETRVLASVKRGNPSEADGFFLERLAASRGEFVGIEMAGPAPDGVRSAIGDREFLTDAFVELFEGTEAEKSFRLKAEATETGKEATETGKDFRADVEHWLERILTAPPTAKRQPRVADSEP